MDEIAGILQRAIITANFIFLNMHVVRISEALEALKNKLAR